MTRTGERRTTPLTARRWGAGLVVALVAALAGPAPMATAAPPAMPGNLAISQPDSATTTLSWAPVSGAGRYEVEVDDDPTFASPHEPRVTTVNSSYVPRVALSSGTNHWRVRALNASGESSDWAQASFGSSALSVPQLLSPVGGRNLQQPTDPPLLTWSAVPGADRYQVIVDGDADLVGGLTYSTKHNSLVVPALLGQGDWFWQVTAQKGNYSSFPSTLGSFNVLSMPTPTLRSPLGGVAVQDVVLDWDPVPGAKSYDVQVSTNRDFTVGDARILDVTGVVSTRYSPPVSFDNASYFWRVRAVDVDGNAPDWTSGSIGAFTRNYPHVPAPVHPADNATVGDPLYLQWSPIKHASEYELALSTSPGFSPGETGYCRVAGTTYTPGLFALNTENARANYLRRDEGCRVEVPGARYYWKVRALDRPFAKSGAVPGIQGEYSPTRSFLYNPAPQTGTWQMGTPATGQQVAIDGGGHSTGQACTAAQGGCVLPTTPTLKWDPVPGAAFYLVYMSRDPSFTNLLEPVTRAQATTNTMYHPTLANDHQTYADRTAGADNLGDAYYWHIRPCESANVCNDAPVSTSGMVQHTFKKESVRPTGLTSSDPAGTEITFTWNDYRTDNANYVWPQTGERANQSAMRYRIQVDDDASFGSPVETALMDQPTYTAPGLLYPDGSYYWRVQAVDSTDNGLAWSETRTFTKRSPQVSVISPTLDQTAADATAFRWNAQNFAGTYDVELYRNNDQTFSTANRVFMANNLKTTAYAHNEPLAPADTPYLWRVRRTDAKGNKGPWNAPTSFRVAAGTPEIVSPAQGGSQPATAPVVSWRPVIGAVSYAATIRPASGSGATESTTTVASSFAATKRFPTGNYVAEVTARNAAGANLGRSTVSFTVDSGLRAITPPRIDAPSGAGVGQVIVSTPPVWNQPEVADAYQWLREGVAISGATATTYMLTPNDLGKAITLRVTGTKLNFDNGVTVSNAIGGIAGDGLVATTLPAVTGTPAPLNSLSVSDGSWSQPQVSVTFQWLRNGVPIPDATRRSYRLGPEDAAQTITVQVTASKIGYASGTATTAPVTVAKSTSKTTVSILRSTIAPGKRAKINVSVSVPAVTQPVGKIKILRGKKVIKTVTLKAKKNGRISVRLPKLKKGKHKIRATYVGSSQIAKSRSKVLKLTVGRR